MSFSITNSTSIETILEQGLTELGISFTDKQHQQLINYVQLLRKWNDTYNLTAIKDPRTMIIKHLLDSLAIQNHVPDKLLLDVGTGAGLPGIPMAIINPEQHWTLLDSNNKKTAFLIYAKAQLGLLNIDVVHARVEQAETDERFAGITSRAYSRLQKFVEQTQHLLAENGSWYAMKGDVQQDEVDEIIALGLTISLKTLQVPFLDDIRHLIIITK